MSRHIVIENGDVLSAYKEYYLNSLISLSIWKASYPKLWEDAGGETLSYNGRNYFGGNCRLDYVSTPEKEKLLKKTGIDQEGVDEIRRVCSDSDVNHVDMRLLPTQTFTLEGLRYFLNNKVQDTLVDESISSFETYHYTEWSSTQNSSPIPVIPPKILPTAQVYDDAGIHNQDFELYGYSVGSSSADVNESLELLYRLTTWFEDFENINTSVVEETRGSDLSIEYRYKTIITITLLDLSYLTSYTTTEALYDLIYLGDTIYDYSYSVSEGTYSWMKFALLLWNLEYPLQHNYNTFSYPLENNDTVIYYSGKYWIDVAVWKKAHPSHCLLTLGRLVDINIVQDKGGFWNTFVGSLLRLIISVVSELVTLLGKIVYTVLWVWGLWTLDILANKNIIKKTSLKKFKKISYQVLGTIALIVLTVGISEAVQAAEIAAAEATALEVGTVEAYATLGKLTAAAAAPTSTFEMIEMLSQVVGAGVSEYSQLNTDEADNARTAAEIEDTKDPIVFVFEEEEENIDIAELFIDSIYDMLDPYADMEL